ncbi:MAG: helix-hairpin-helix domain-containing protein [Ignavibacteriales bacterium]|nr:MAG: helix-hairpin-helix domain-containing protein [Ignavibacteriales bacterium]
MLKKLSVKLNVTLTELRVIVFIIVVLTTGVFIKYVINAKDVKSDRKFDYSLQDSLFKHYTNVDTSQTGQEIANNDVDYKQEVLDFNTRNFEKTEPKLLPAERSIDINKAGIEELKTLPGIGEKTAANIIELREKRGKFRNINELLDVKGIGNSKFNKIKKFIFIDH